MGKQNRDACFLQWETCGRNGSYRSPNPHRVPEVTSPPSRAAAVPAFWCIQWLLGKAYRALSTSMDNLAWLFLMAKKIIMVLSLLWTFSKLEEWVPEKENTFSFSGFATVFRYFNRYKQIPHSISASDQCRKGWKNWNCNENEGCVVFEASRTGRNDSSVEAAVICYRTGSSHSTRAAHSPV